MNTVIEGSLIQSQQINNDWNHLADVLLDASLAIRNHDIAHLLGNAHVLLLDIHKMGPSLPNWPFPDVWHEDHPTPRCEKRSSIEKRQCKFVDGHHYDCLFLL